MFTQKSKEEIKRQLREYMGLNTEMNKMSIKISETDKEKIRNGDLACVIIPPEFFEDGDYSQWQNNSD